VADIKFCGLTRAEDAAYAGELGAAYVGVVFAGGPRSLTVDQASRVLERASGARRVGVFGSQSIAEIARAAERLSLDVVQLHADPTPESVETLRPSIGAEIWAAIRTRSSLIPEMASELAAVADGLLFDARSEGALGGTGMRLDWGSLRVPRGRARFILAGGLTPESVGEAIRSASPDVVDVSSGVESEPGIKDRGRMRAFADAVRTRPSG
jgi:phosphoribosylanthranilate isomerase